MAEHTAFFYGTLMAPEILYRVIYGSSILTPVTSTLAAKLTIRPAMLHGYCRHKVVGCDYPGIISHEGHCVRGTYVEGLTDGDIYRLDTFEGDEYERKVVSVKLIVEGEKETEGEEKQAGVYVYTAGDDLLEKEEWDFDEFRREKMFRWTDASWEYKEVDDAVASTGDPTGGRYIANGSLSAEQKEAADVEVATKAAV